MRTISQPGTSPRPARAPAGPAADARRLHALLVGLMRRRSLRDPLAASCAELDLSAPQVHTLLALGHEGALAMGDLARRVAVTEKTITGLVDRLQRDGLVERRRDGADRRVIHVGLTAAGAALAGRLDAEVLQALTRLLSRLGAADRRDLFRIIEKLTHSLEDT
ncbi:MAG: MarR family transcriptional regulator [Anaeromyxobacteraceae bacterium]|nr:MarR family transcriptional regulator [Anaeromyxobacteraceae bacterium]